MELRAKTATRKRTATQGPRAARSTKRQLQALTPDQIAARARELYERSGCQPGRDEEFWLEAERQLQGERKV